VNNLVNDKRSGRIAIVAHCILNQNSRVLGLAERSSTMTEIVEFLMSNDIGIVQMPCPELSYAGILREGKTKDQYDTVMFRSHCRRTAKEIVEQIQEYAKCKIRTEIVVGVDGSPSCGVSQTSKERSSEKVSKNRRESSGILIDELRFVLEEKKIQLPFYGIKYERLPEDLEKIERLLEG